MTTPPHTPRLEAEEAIHEAITAGFAAAGVVALPYAGEALDAERFEAWLARGHAATMSFLSDCDTQGRRLRANARTPFPWARSAIVCVAPYPGAALSPAEPRDEGLGRIARYAQSSKPTTYSQRFQAEEGRLPSDYHRVLTRRLERLNEALRARLGAFEAQACVDSHPLNERALAVAAGLGWTGKNCSLIHPKLGSFTLLAVLLTSLEANTPANLPEPIHSRCGLCRRCLEACPTGALLAPGRLDARRCLSYLTIEHRGPIEESLMERMGSQVFGCDICLEVCPWNRSVTLRDADPELTPRETLAAPALEWLGSLAEAEFVRLANGSPLRRANYWEFLRNVAVAMGDARLGRFRWRLQAWSEAADEGLRQAAQWALRRVLDSMPGQTSARDKS